MKDKNEIIQKDNEKKFPINFREKEYLPRQSLLE
jgi:hypothetical protein